MMFIILAEGFQIPPNDVVGTAVEEPVVSWLLGACVQGWDRPGRDLNTQVCQFGTGLFLEHLSHWESLMLRCHHTGLWQVL